MERGGVGSAIGSSPVSAGLVIGGTGVLRSCLRCRMADLEVLCVALVMAARVASGSCSCFSGVN
jgi:hypothetical protein